MNTLIPRLAVCGLVSLFASAGAVTAAGPYALLHPLYDPSPVPAPDARLGSGVAISTFVAVTALPNDDAGPFDSGLVRVYDRTDGNLLHTLASPSPETDDRFGSAVATWGTFVVAGAEEGQAGGVRAGLAYVFHLAGATPTVPFLTLTNPTPGSFDLFGSAIAMSGLRIVVGAYRDRVGTTQAGAVHVFDLGSATPGAAVLTLTNPTPASLDLFGFAVAVSGAWVAVGARGDDAGAVNSGVVHLFDLAGPTPTVPFVTIENPSVVAEENFGYAVGLGGTRLVVGKPYSNLGGASSGVAYVFDVDGAARSVPFLTLTNPTPADSDFFGGAVATDGSRVAVAAANNATGADRGGTVHVYDLGEPVPAVPVASLSNPRPPGQDSFGESVALAGAHLVVGAPFDDSLASGAGQAYLFGPPPRLSIGPDAPGRAVLGWTPPTTSGFVLQYTDGLAPANWLPAPSGGTNPVSVVTTNAARFYRVAQP